MVTLLTQTWRAPGRARKLISACASRGLAAALTAETGPRRPAEAAPNRDNGHGRAPENASHLTAAFASGRSDSEEGSENQASTVDRADRGLSPAAAGREAGDQ